MAHMQFDRQKLKDVVHYICASTQPAELGKIKLHKALYFSDMLHFLEQGRPLTGVTYQKQPFGPCAKHLSWALDELLKDQRISISESNYFGYAKFDFRSIAPPRLERLAEHEIALLDEVIDFVCARSAKEISDLSVNEAWSAAEMGEELPYYTAFLLVPREITDDDVAWGEREMRALAAAE